MGERPPAPYDAARRSVHARLVLAPAGFWSAGLVLDIVSRFSAGPDALVRTATWLIGLGLVGAVFAGIAGMVEAAPVPTGSAAHRRVLGTWAWRWRSPCSSRSG